MFWYALLYIISSFTFILTRKRELVVLLLLSFGCLTVNVMWLFLTVKWVVLQFVIVVFPDHTHLRFFCEYYILLSETNYTNRFINKEIICFLCFGSFIYIRQ